MAEPCTIFRLPPRYDLNVLAIRHRGEKLTTQLEDQTLDFGDTLLVAGGWGEIRRLRDEPEDFVVLTLPAEYSELMPARHRAPIAVAILVVMVAVMASQLVANAAAVLIAALAMIVTRCVKLDSIYRIVNWKTVVLVAGTLPLATALTKTGATAMMAHGLVGLLGSLGPLAMLAAVFLVTAVDRAVHFQLGHRSADRTGRHRCRTGLARLAARVCNNGFASAAVPRL